MAKLNSEPLLVSNIIHVSEMDAKVPLQDSPIKTQMFETYPGKEPLSQRNMLKIFFLISVLNWLHNN